MEVTNRTPEVKLRLRVWLSNRIFFTFGRLLDSCSLSNITTWYDPNNLYERLLTKLGWVRSPYTIDLPLWIWFSHRIVTYQFIRFNDCLSRCICVRIWTNRMNYIFCKIQIITPVSEASISLGNVPAVELWLAPSLLFCISGCRK